MPLPSGSGLRNVLELAAILEARGAWTECDQYARAREQLDLRLLEIRYEDLIADPETEIRRMLDFVGVGFEVRGLSFHENARVPRTGSYLQVNRKLYGTSVYRYRNYRQHLAAAAEILRPTIAQLGYTED